MQVEHEKNSPLSPSFSDLPRIFQKRKPRESSLLASYYLKEKTIQLNALFRSLHMPVTTKNQHGCNHLMAKAIYQIRNLFSSFFLRIVA